ncbi:tudor domain-containing protein 3-like [Anthonomus grandis grandis]|uniref:tudor domain-containing protein 3-like n=1 Tax=Anthonomus grandis grandis TaxID=2921223 RepID=UPI0021669F7F|nr:tudor domain-containing protein 3-like [Anthonomus grandis grandis]
MSSQILGPEWSLCPDGINIVTENGTVKDPKTALKKALDSDLKTIGKSTLPNQLSKSQIGKVVLQIQKIRNTSAPKSREESQAAPRMLKLTLTDGESYVQAIESTHISSISREKTAPGTKVLINGAPVVSGYLLISPNNCTVLGGQVAHMYEKWLLAKSVQQSHRQVSNDGAPPWVAFGHKILSGNHEKGFKSLEKGKEGGGNSEFDQQRKEAIAEASTGAVKKTFSGRVKQNVQPVQTNQQYNRGKPNERGDSDRGRRGKFSRDDGEVEKPQKPSEKVSLFSFLEDKLPATESKKPAAPSPSCNKNNCQNYHQKDPRIQQRAEARQNGKPLDKNAFNKDRPVESNASLKPMKEKATINNVEGKAPGRMETGSKSNVNNGTVKASNDKRNSQSISTDSSRTPQKYSRDQTATNDIMQQNQGHSQTQKYSQQQHNNYNQYKGSNDRQNHTTNYRKDSYNQQQYPANTPQSSYNQKYSNQQYAQQQQFNPNHNLHNQQPYQTSIPQAVDAQLNTEEMHQLANNLSKMSVSNEFASRSLRQHLNLGPPKKQEPHQQQNGSFGPQFKVGDQCLAKYWEDGKFYPAIIAAITDKTYAVQFKGYGNIEEVLKNDCFSATANIYNQPNKNYSNNYNNYQQNNFSGTSMEFRSRRGPPRN